MCAAPPLPESQLERTSFRSNCCLSLSLSTSRALRFVRTYIRDCYIAGVEPGVADFLCGRFINNGAERKSPAIFDDTNLLLKIYGRCRDSLWLMCIFGVWAGPLEDCVHIYRNKWRKPYYTHVGKFIVRKRCRLIAYGCLNYERFYII